MAKMRKEAKPQLTSFAEFVFLGSALVLLEFVVKSEASSWGDLGGEEEKAIVLS